MDMLAVLLVQGRTARSKHGNAQHRPRELSEWLCLFLLGNSFFSSYRSILCGGSKSTSATHYASQRGNWRQWGT